MYLKSIEIQGFKSFANKIVFQFHNGITGIVGPNGSGKSNVADAVRWVLGEQRIKQLRGASMQDVIFSGTEMRKPLSYAYVAITLDNADHQLAIDYDEVTVARRIYRSGESEYLINGTAVRLKDVNELFYDTGIGKEGYSIIGQGQIDKILSGKPEERRELFDEAAGIVKFKRRKAAAQSKLENEKQNLVRVNDILSELEKQVEPLSRQAEKARIYLKKKEEQKALDVNVFLLENDRLKKELFETSEKYMLAESALSETGEKYEGIRKEYELLEEGVNSLEKTIEQTRQSLTDWGLSKGRLEGEINVLREQIRSAAETREHLMRRLDAVREELSARQKEKEALLQKKTLTDTETAAITRRRDELKERLSGLQERIEELTGLADADRNRIIEELNQRAVIKSRMSRLDTMTEQIQIRKAQMNSRLLRAKSDEAEREETVKGLQQVFEEVTGELTQMNGQEKEMEKALLQIREELTARDASYRELQGRYHQESSRLEALQNLTERYEGYGGSVKKVMECKDREPGIIGVVADIIKTKKQYETAIETALGGSIQNIVTREEETAKRMIRYLKTNRLGRATFLPLTSLSRAQEFRNDRALAEKGVIGTADSLVTIEEQYRNVARSLLGRILVVDNMDNAVLIARKYDYTIRMVTLEGELLVPGGAISGGAFKNSSNLLGRRRELSELARQTQELLASSESVNEQIAELKSRRNRLRMELETLKAQIQRKSIEQNTARLNVVAAREKLQEEAEDYQALRREQKEIEEQTAALSSEREEILSGLSASEEAEKAAGERIAGYTAELEEKRTQESEISLELNGWELKAEKGLQAVSFHQANIDRIEGEMLRFAEEEAQIQRQTEENQASALEKQEKIELLQQEIASSEEQKELRGSQMKEQLLQKEELSLRQKNFFKEREELAAQLASLDKEVYRLNAQKEKLEESIETQINYMWDEYEVTLSDAALLRNEALTELSVMKKEIASLKDQIRKLGDVNVNAIEDYRSLMERYTFLKTQHEDLVEAEKTLEQIIAELDSAMRKQFSEKFSQIRQEFDKVFKELFGGGKGTLELQEEEDILEAGIKIIAQPPGKKLQNMMQLSGGEKALAAISLLFAIQNLKPSPFCLLDEIEAALDESNVGRFARYLHKLTKNTQFIVITHRRGTMEQVDRLYGITMQEKGISALVSVNLIDKDLED